jgi:flagellar assembly protein FliH
MTLSSPETRVLAPVDAHRVAPARLDARLRGTDLLHDLRPDARVVDPRLVAVVEDAARTAAERGHTEGWDAGYAAGLAEGRAAAAEEAARRRRTDEAALAAALERIGSATDALVSAADHLEQLAAPAFDSAGHDLGALVHDLVEGLLGQELEADRLHVVGAIRRASLEAVRGAALRLHLNPHDVAALSDAGVDIAAVAHRDVRVVADASVPLGSAVADSGARHIDATLDGARARLRAALLGEEAAQ